MHDRHVMALGSNTEANNATFIAPTTHAGLEEVVPVKTLFPKYHR